MRLIFTNNFHNKSVNVNAPRLRVTSAQMKRMEKALCGMSDCSCGSWTSVEDNTGALLFVANEDDQVTVFKHQQSFWDN